MSNTYTWRIINDGLLTLPELNGKNNVVTLVSFDVEVSNNVNTATIRRHIPTTYTEGNAFTEFANLTETQVINWVKASSENFENNIQMQLDEKLARITTPSIAPIVKSLPWQNV